MSHSINNLDYWLQQGFVYNLSLNSNDVLMMLPLVSFNIENIE